MPPCIAVPVPAVPVAADGTVGDGGVDFEVDGAGRRAENDVRLSEDFEARALDANETEGTDGTLLFSPSCVMSAVLLLRECLNFLKSAIGKDEVCIRVVKV